jgi:hypothetical protein
MNLQYDVLSPWAEADPVPPHGISPRLIEMKDKTIGLFINSKISALPIRKVVEEKLRESHSSIKFSYFTHLPNMSVMDTEDKNKFRDWVSDLDAAIFSVGD